MTAQTSPNRLISLSVPQKILAGKQRRKTEDTSLFNRAEKTIIGTLKSFTAKISACCTSLSTALNPTYKSGQAVGFSTSTQKAKGIFTLNNIMKAAPLGVLALNELLAYVAAQTPLCGPPNCKPIVSPKCPSENLPRGTCLGIIEARVGAALNTINATVTYPPTAGGLLAKAFFLPPAQKAALLAFLNNTCVQKFISDAILPTVNNPQPAGLKGINCIINLPLLLPTNFTLSLDRINIHFEDLCTSLISAFKNCPTLPNYETEDTCNQKMAIAFVVLLIVTGLAISNRLVNRKWCPEAAKDAWGAVKEWWSTRKEQDDTKEQLIPLKHTYGTTEETARKTGQASGSSEPDSEL